VSRTKRRREGDPSFNPNIPLIKFNACLSWLAEGRTGGAEMKGLKEVMDPHLVLISDFHFMPL